MADDVRVQALRAAIAVAPADTGLRRLLADALLASGDPEAAIGEYRECLRTDHDDRPTLLGLARSYRAAGKRSAALMAIDDLMARAGDDAEAEILRARLLLESGQREEAAAAYRRAVEADPGVEDAGLAGELGGLILGAVHDATRDPASAASGPGQPAPADRAPAAEVPPEVIPAIPVTLRADPGSDDADEDVDRSVDIVRPRIDFGAVGGMEDLKEEIRTKIIHPIAHPDLYAAYGRTAGGGILMYGPPGCGKTHLARATAGEVRAGFLSIGISDVLDMWLGRSERNLHDLFATARRHRPCVLFFDEVEAIGGNRSDLRASAGRTVVNQFLAELDGADASNEGVLILGATNAPWHLDNAFRRPGRFDRVLFVPPPDEPARAQILRILLEGKPAPDVDHGAIARKTDGFSGADLKGVVDLAIEAKLQEALRERIPRPIETKDLAAAVKRVVPSTREWFATARNYVMYANEGGLYDAVRPYLGR